MKKINFGRHAKQLERLITDNSPTILTAIGVVGVAGTAVLTWKAAVKATDVVNIEQTEKDAPLSKAEKFSITWKLYIAPFVAGTLTCAAIVGANRISAKRAAAIAGVLALTQDDLKTYKEKVEERLSGPQNKKLKDELAEEKAKNAINDAVDPILVGEGDVYCIEAYTGRPFSSSREKIIRAENEFNRRMLRGDDALCLSEFYDLLRGLDHTAVSDQFGWNTSLPLEIEFTSTVTKSGKPALVMNYVEAPVFRPWNSGQFR